MAEVPDAPSSPFGRLIRRLQLESPRTDEFVGGSGVGGVTVERRLYGGLVAAQAAVAAARTVDDMTIHSLHAYFLRPGRAETPIRLEVTRTKQGRNFHARRVSAWQRDELIFELQASFSALNDGVAHQADMPDSPAPDDAPNRDRLRGRSDWREMPIDVRMCVPIATDTPMAPEKRAWMRPRQPFPDDQLLHLGLLVYASDRTLLSTAWRPHAHHGEMAGASLDHSMWFHDRPRFDDWLLYAVESPAAARGSGLSVGGFYRCDGSRVATVAQEGTLTPRKR